MKKLLFLLHAFGQNALTFVGAGTNASNRAIHFFAEGGTTMSGPLNIGGALRVNGNPGSTGQVLTSTGTGSPEWQNSSYSNNTRFSVGLDESTSLLSGNAVFVGTHYNLDPANVIINTSSITINKAGLYHFDIVAFGEVIYSPAPTGSYPKVTLNLNVGAYTNPIRLIGLRVMDPTSDSKLAWQFHEAISVNIHIPAPTTISLSYSYSAASPGGGFPLLNGNLTGSLISE